MLFLNPVIQEYDIICWPANWHTLAVVLLFECM